jgi:hypothetical protein
MGVFYFVLRTDPREGMWRWRSLLVGWSLKKVVEAGRLGLKV